MREGGVVSPTWRSGLQLESVGGKKKRKERKKERKDKIIIF